VGEFLPVLFGVIVAGVSQALPLRARPVVFPATCVLAGALASGINGELADGAWMLFVSFDALLVWAAAAVTLAVAWMVRHQRALS